MIILRSKVADGLLVDYLADSANTHPLLRKLSADVHKIDHGIREHRESAFAIAGVRPPRAALLASNGDLPSVRFSAKLNRAFSPESCGLLRVYSPTTQGHFKRRHHPNTEPCTRVAALESNTIDLVIVNSNLSKQGQMRNQKKGRE